MVAVFLLQNADSETMGDSMDSKEKSTPETPETMDFHGFSHQGS